MYLFEAKYHNRKTGQELTRTVEIDECSYGYEKDIYISAIAIAYDKKEVDEELSSLEFLAC